jgi:DNA polymerase III alpha subunit
MITPEFVHLRVHSEYSLIDSVVRVGTLTARARELGLAALALTDVGGAERILDTLSALIKTRDDRVAFPREVVARLAAAC